ncbi:hypothetical protein COB64_01840 [Candidatus Wolfebacteria bacterium]|nr:MAG: hypothetical protein COB64_01840 [Candidatus Wolfebacteria bacterium]
METITGHIINCNIDPFTPNGWIVERHLKGGDVVWDPSKIDLCLSKKQQKGDRIFVWDLRDYLSNKNVLNANVLDYLLMDSRLIPEDWKGKSIMFWGTIYHYKGKRIRYLRWHDGEWRCEWRWVEEKHIFNHREPAAILKG